MNTLCLKLGLVKRWRPCERFQSPAIFTPPAVGLEAAGWRHSSVSFIIISEEKTAVVNRETDALGVWFAMQIGRFENLLSLFNTCLKGVAKLLINLLLLIDQWIIMRCNLRDKINLVHLLVFSLLSLVVAPALKEQDQSALPTNTKICHRYMQINVYITHFLEGLCHLS